MLTEEQIKNLKKGDKVLAEVEVFAITESGQLMLKSLDEWPLDQIYPLPTPPKHDPTRLFKKGDIVELRKYHGRPVFCLNTHREMENLTYHYTVVEDEQDSFVKISPDPVFSHGSFCVHVSSLSLISRTEELERFRLTQNFYSYDVYDRATEDLAARFNSKIFPFAQEEAQRLCDRLNAEHGKEQK